MSAVGVARMEGPMWWVNGRSRGTNCSLRLPPTCRPDTWHGPPVPCLGGLVHGVDGQLAVSMLTSI